MMQKTPLARSKPMRTAPAPPKPAPGPKPKACRVCRVKFVPSSPLAAVCGVPCAIENGKRMSAKQKARARSQERAQDRVKREGMKRIPELIAEAQIAFNLFIRLRDLAAGHGCICCGKFATAAALAKPGGAYDACHFRSRGSAGHLRFNEDNVHLGLKDCNTWGHVDYRGGLLRRIGLERLEALEANNAVHKWTHDELREIRDTYRKRAAQLKKEMTP